MLFFLSIYVVGIISTMIHIIALPEPARNKAKIIELILLYQLIFSIGITSLVAFFGLTFLDQYIAKYTDWPACPFQQELANVNLAFGVLGILCIWFDTPFWMATIIGFSIWIFGDGIHHLYEAYVNKNFSSGNIGPMLYTDLIVPIVLIVLLYLHRASSKSSDRRF